MFIQFLKNSKRLAPFVVLGCMAGLANADEVHFTGSTMGRFNGDLFTNTCTLLDLTYTNSIFDNTTVGNELDLGANSNPGSNFNNLGSFTLGSMDNDYNGNTFNLMVTFTAPTVIAGGTSATFTDKITGTVSSGSGGVFIDFDNTPQLFTFANGAATGSFTFFINDVSISPGQDGALTGHINGSQDPVPESSIWAGLGAGVLGFVGLRRKR